MTEQCQNNKEEESGEAGKRESEKASRRESEQNDQASKLDDIVDATELLRQGNARIAKARQLLNEIPEYLYLHDTLAHAHWHIDENVKKLEQLTVLIDEHNEIRELT